MDRSTSAKGPATVKLAGWIVLGFGLFSLNPVGIVVGFLILRYADRIAGRIGGRIAGASKLAAGGRAAGARGGDGPPGRDGTQPAPRDQELLVDCPFCRKPNKPNSGKCESCGYAM